MFNVSLLNWTNTEDVLSGGKDASESVLSEALGLVLKASFISVCVVGFVINIVLLGFIIGKVITTNPSINGLMNLSILMLKETNTYFNF